MKSHLLYVLIILMSSMIYGQPKFINKTHQYKSAFPTRSLIPGASLDVNGDLIDDIVVIDRGKVLYTFMSTGKHFALQNGQSIKVSPIGEWSLAAGDLNNDGYQDVITAGQYTIGSICALNPNQYTRKQIVTHIYAQGSNMVDINNDGWLDYYISNEDGPSKIFINDGTGNLIETKVIDFLINDNTDGSGNYGSTWADVNGDFKPDLVLSKCKGGVDDPTDQRRINRLYINHGDGTFSDQGAAFNLNSGAQTWATVVADLDNDGDMDALVVNHYSPHQLMENINNQSFEEQPLPEHLASFSFQAAAADFDNDGLIDIFLGGGNGGILLHNKGEIQFEIIKTFLGNSPVNSFTLGDYNDDGCMDIYAHLGISANEVGVKDDELWLNAGNENHYIKINLTGQFSNRSGISAHLSVYSGNNKWVRYVTSGDGYGAVNSLQQHIGLGKVTQVDSLIIRWPSGFIDKYYDLEVDHTYYAQEDICMTRQIELYDTLLIYKNEDVLLSALDSFATYTWSNNKHAQQINVSPGMYHVSMSDSKGCTTISKPIRVVSGCFDENTQLLPVNDTLFLCDGNELKIVASSATSYLWQDQSTSQEFIAHQSGWVTLTAQDYCGNALSDSIYVQVLNPDLSFEVKGDSIRQGERAILTSSHENTEWFQWPDTGTLLGRGNKFITNTLDTTTTFAGRLSILSHKISDKVGNPSFPQNNFYHTDNASGALYFIVKNDCIIHSMKVNTDTRGLRRIYILRNKVDTVFARNFELESGISTIILDAKLTIGDYSIATDENVNITHLGHASPRLVRTSGDTNYPYLLENVVEIVSSTFGPTVYLYFYDWEVYHELLYCQSDFKLADVVVDINTFVKNVGFEDIVILPNPITESIHILTKYDFDKLIITDINGSVTTTFNNQVSTINCSHWPPGLYFATFFRNGQTSTFKLIKT
ncbi:MAG: VCBS repeat-containing protein [Saprospiraceae bacterium]|nr:VCBS repeat-containing protein [Saprospiraceae bacterium]MCZ2337987.1 FG-GAP-like repeat-containing protein [Chitinophagales bacterium]